MVRREPAKKIIASVPDSDPLRAFAVGASLVLVDLGDSNDNLVVLSNCRDVLAVYRRSAGQMRAWQQFTQYLPSIAPDSAGRAAREMAAWMFEHRDVASILSLINWSDASAREFSEAQGGKLVWHDDNEAIYQIIGAQH